MVPLRSRAVWVGAAIVAAVAAFAPAFALLIQPVVIRMQSSGAKSSAAITVVNDRNTPNTVEVSVSKLGVPVSGPVALTPDSGDDFLIFPPVATIQPGATQVFRIRWVGEPVLPQAKTYMFTTKEIPVDQPGTGVQLVYAIQSLVTVSSAGLKSQPDVAAIERTMQVSDDQARAAENAKPVPGLLVTFANAGNDIVYLSDYEMHISVDGPKTWTLTLPGKDVAQYIGLGLLAPASQRKLFMAIPGVPATGNIKISFKRDNLVP